MKFHWLFPTLAVASAACELELSYYVPVTQAEYTSNGVCSGVELTNNNEKNRGIGYLYRTEERTDAVVLTPGQPVRIPDPNPQPRKTYYILGFDYSERNSAEVDLTWRCLPDKQPLRLQFTFYSKQRPLKGLRITENPTSPHGFNIDVVDF